MLGLHMALFSYPPCNFVGSGKHMIGLHLRNNFDVSNYAFVLIT